ncbi:MAG: MOSC domain-containing protein [Saprospiraceae bacterium]|nr:MOSC domain-containing protein [Saprospiraceae bacterium]
MLTLTQINVFPVKSLDGYSPQSAVVEKQGLQYDRRWMITDEKGLFMTLRNNKRMALLKAVVEDNQLLIFEKENPQNGVKLSIFDQITEGVMDTEIWDDRVVSVLVSPEANAFLSDFLGKKCQLVTMPPHSQRRVDEDFNTGDDIVSYADGFPFLIIGEASMVQLNEKIAERKPSNAPLSMRRFRTNFVFSGGTPFAEDYFGDFRIGEVDFKGVKPCGRCVMTTQDPDTGEKGKEPLDTLMTFRERGKKILFGQNVIWNNQKWQWAWQPEVKVGDPITVF